MNGKSEKRLILNLSSSIISFLVSFGISFFLTPYLTSTLGRETYQFYPIANNFITYMTIVVSALNSMASRFIALEVIGDRKDNVNKYFSSLFFSNIILSVSLALPMSAIVTYADRFLNIPDKSVIDVKVLFFFVFSSMIIDVIGSVYGVATIAKDRIELRSFCSIFISLLKAGLLFYIFKKFEPKLFYIGIISLIVSTCQFFLQVIITKKLIPYVKISAKSFDFNYVKKLLASGVWNSINSLGSILLAGITLVMTNILVNSTESGNLSLAQTVSHVINSIITTITVVFLPRLIRGYADEKYIGLLSEARFGQMIISSICSVIIILLTLFGNVFFSLWVPNEDHAKLAQILNILLIPLFFQANMWLLNDVLVTINKVKSVALINLIAGCINICVLYVYSLVTNASAFGMATISSICSSLLYTLFYPVYVAKVTQTSVTSIYKLIFRACISALITLLAGFYLFSNFIISDWFEFFFCGGICGFIMLIIYVVLFIPNNEKKKYITIVK